MSRPWIIWIALTAVGGAYLASSLPSSDSATSASTLFLPGETTHGHHQIEMKCGVCHTPGGEVREQSCLDCHADELKAALDTHPRTKFIDPTKAVLLQKVDATNCLVCHVEHVDERTVDVGLTLPIDYCFHCHENVADDRPSHTGLGFDTCLNAGCHDFHDNTALNENFLRKHLDESDVLDAPLRLLAKANPPQTASEPLRVDQQDAPADVADETVVVEWFESAHARGGVNCTACHVAKTDSGSGEWSNGVSRETCRGCHEFEADRFLDGLHGMRLAVDLPAMTPADARLPMKHDALHRTLDCNACHTAHADDTRHAAAAACLGCHDDEHSRAYESSSHFELWKRELAGDAPAGSGVSCATCHMPRIEVKGAHRVQHDQSWNLEPNEKMARSVCVNCHGLSFTLDALADRSLIDTCYGGPPSVHVESLEMVRRWFESRKKPSGRK